MSTPLKPGDSAYVMRNHCSDEMVGKIITVGLLTPVEKYHCMRCDAYFVSAPTAAVTWPGKGWPLSWLLKIEPPSMADREFVADAMREESHNGVRVRQ